MDSIAESPSQAPIMSPLLVRKKKDVHLGDFFFARVLRTLALLFLFLLISIGFFLLWGAWPALQHFGFRFLTQTTWDPVRNIFGAAPVLYGTLVSSFLAVGLATPISIGIALYLTELAPRKWGAFLGFFVEMLASIPSIVYGLWGIFVLSPWMRNSLEPVLIRLFGFLPLFRGPPYGVGMLTAGLILSLMIIPTIVSICREVFQVIPKSLREGALALGATRWEMIRVAVLKNSHWGIWGAVLLALGRALGETMAVTLVIGNRTEISPSLLAPAQTMASTIANEYAEAGSQLHLAALMEIGLLLFLVTLILNSVAYFILLKKKRPVSPRSV